MNRYNYYTNNCNGYSNYNYQIVAGPAGPQGSPGPMGPQGFEGPRGPQGVPGPIGPIGVQGVAGPIGPTGAQGITGPIGPTGAQGIVGPIGPLAPQSFVQLFDSNYSNELTSERNLNLSAIGISPEYTTGEYSLTTTEVTNDTLNLPEPGLYHISLSLKVSFLQPVNPGDKFGKSFQVLFTILDQNNPHHFPDLLWNGMIPKDENDTLEAQLSTQFLYNATVTPPQLKVKLSNFDFSLAFKNTLSVFDIVFIVQKWEKP